MLLHYPRKQQGCRRDRGKYQLQLQREWVEEAYRKRAGKRADGKQQWRPKTNVANLETREEQTMKQQWRIGLQKNVREAGWPPEMKEEENVSEYTDGADADDWRSSRGRKAHWRENGVHFTSSISLFHAKKRGRRRVGRASRGVRRVGFRVATCHPQSGSGNVQKIKNKMISETMHFTNTVGSKRFNNYDICACLKSWQSVCP